jgi:hypothetical protein
MEAQTRNGNYDIRWDDVPDPGIAHFDVCGFRSASVRRCDDGADSETSALRGISCQAARLHQACDVMNRSWPAF